MDRIENLLRHAGQRVTLAEGLTLLLLPASIALFLAAGVPYGYLFMEAARGVIRLSFFFLPVIILKLTFDFSARSARIRQASYLIYFSALLGLFLFSPLFGYLPRESEIKRLSILFIYLSLISLAFYVFLSVKMFMKDRKEHSEITRNQVSTVTVVARASVLLILCYVVHSNLKAAIPLLRVYAWDLAAWRLDTLLFAGNDPYRLLHAALSPERYTLFFEQFYFFFFYFNAFGLSSAFVFGSGRYLLKVTNTVVLAYHVGLVLYWVFPTLGPCFFTQTAHLFNQLPEIMTLKPMLYDGFRRIITTPASFKPDLFSGIAAFPSLHVSHSLIYLVYLWPRQRTLTLLNIPAFLLLCASTVYLGWHYVIDIPAGVLVGVFAIWIVRKTWK